MPEGVEVKLSVDLIRPLVMNKTIATIYVGDKSRYAGNPPEGFQQFEKLLTKETVTVKNINVYGKFMYWQFSNDWYLMNTFGMSGQWSPKEGKHPCFKMYFQNLSAIIFNDPRHFGTIKLVDSFKEVQQKLSKLGWDPFHISLRENNTFDRIRSKLRNTNKFLAEILMDQNIFAGVGNYIKCESLYAAKLSPWRQGNSLSSDEIETLCNCIINVMEESYKHQGATIHTYETAYGEEGKYSSCFKVYGKTTDPLGNPVKTQSTPDKRTTHWCPNVQK